MDWLKSIMFTNSDATTVQYPVRETSTSSNARKISMLIHQIYVTIPASKMLFGNADPEWMYNIQMLQRNNREYIRLYINDKSADDLLLCVVNEIHQRETLPVVKLQYSPRNMVVPLDTSLTVRIDILSQYSGKFETVAVSTFVPSISREEPWQGSTAMIETDPEEIKSGMPLVSMMCHFMINDTPIRLNPANPSSIPVFSEESDIRVM